MRWVAPVKDGGGIVRLMLYETPEGTVYLFLFKDRGDGPAAADQLYFSVADARAAAMHDWGVVDADWTVVSDPPAEGPHDRMAPVSSRAGDCRDQAGDMQDLNSGHLPVRGCPDPPR